MSTHWHTGLTHRMLALLLLACAVTRVSAPSSSAASSPTAKFAVPILVGRSNSSDPDGSNFWFPSISIPTGIKYHIAQHITLSGDGGSCPRPGGRWPMAHCEQIMLSKDGGHTYEVVKTINSGTSGNFDGYGDLGAWVPAKKVRQL
jgi:hypothetical protein